MFKFALEPLNCTVFGDFKWVRKYLVRMSRFKNLSAFVLVHALCILFNGILSLQRSPQTPPRLYRFTAWSASITIVYKYIINRLHVLKWLLIYTDKVSNMLPNCVHLYEQ